MNAAADTWASLQWTTEGSGRAPLLLALAGALVKAGRVEEAWTPLSGGRTRGVLGTPASSSRSAPTRGDARLFTNPFQRQCRIAFVGSFTIDLLAPLLRAQCWGAGFQAAFYVAPFNQIVQELGAGIGPFRFPARCNGYRSRLALARVYGRRT